MQFQQTKKEREKGKGKLQDIFHQFFSLKSLECSISAAIPMAVHMAYSDSTLSIASDYSIFLYPMWMYFSTQHQAPIWRMGLRIR
jgi:hypothetical protein